jgi:DNA topoisomerase-6 subunit B
LQKIALKRTGGQKTDQLLGKNGGGPEGLLDSIIVTPDGVEGDAPELPRDARGEGAPAEQAEPEQAEPALLALNDERPDRAVKGKAVKVKPKSGPKTSAEQQRVLPFIDKSAPGAKPNPETGKKYGKKKGKK